MLGASMFRQLIAITGSLVAGGCITSPPPPPPPITVANWKCFEVPGGAYKAGSLIRSSPSSASATAVPVATDVDINGLVVAWPAIEPASSKDYYADIQRSVVTGVGFSFLTPLLAKWGGNLDLSATDQYTISIKTKDNTMYVADDDVRQRMVTHLHESNALIAGARYYFVKQAIGSKEIAYEVKDKTQVRGTIKLNATSSELSADVTVRDANNAVTSNRELVACIIAEELEIAIVGAGTGESKIAITPKSTSLDSSAVAALREASKK